MPEIPEFQKKQLEFAAHIRDPENVAAPSGIEDRRMAIYRQLFFNNLRNLLATMFPVLRKLHSDDAWHHFIRQFLRHHRAETPYFLQLPQEFVSFLQNEYKLREDDYPFLVELAHYEYVELALATCEASNDLDGVDGEGDLLAGVPIKSELCWVYGYQYPVHRISTNFKPTAPLEQPVFIAVYRRADDSVGFLELNAVSARLLEAIDANTAQQRGEDLLRKIAEELQYSDIAAFIEHGAAALEEMLRLEILTGTRMPA